MVRGCLLDGGETTSGPSASRGCPAVVPPDCFELPHAVAASSGGQRPGPFAEGFPIAASQTESTSPARSYDGLPLARLAAQTADAMRGKDTVLLDMRQSTPIVDYFVITTASSPRQMKSIATEVKTRLRSGGSSRAALEGEESSQWLGWLSQG